jgi:hypothetical protein
MRLTFSEEVGKYKAHYKKREQGRKHAPKHTEVGAFVFLLEITLYKLGEEEPVFLKFLYQI